jgi:hypothetical protein
LGEEELEELEVEVEILSTFFSSLILNNCKAKYRSESVVKSVMLEKRSKHKAVKT